MSNSAALADAAVRATREPHGAMQHLLMDASFADHLETLVMAFFLMELASLSREQIGSLLRCHRQSGLNLAHLALRHSLCRYQSALDVVKATRELNGMLRCPARLLSSG